MSKNSKTDDKAFNSLRFNKIDWKAESINSQKAIQAEKAKRLTLLFALIDADETKLRVSQSVTKVKAEEIRFSGMPEYLDSKYKYENSK
jgi:hypothetical protein